MPSDDETVRAFHGETMERQYCLGEECPDKNCKICPAADKAKFVLDVTDSYRQKVKGGYYSTSIIEVVDPVTGKKKYIYSRPG